MELNCNTNHLPIDKIVTSLLRKVAASGLVGLPIVEVAGHNTPAMNCDNNHLKFEDFLRLVIGIDGICGKPALRVKIIDSCDLDINCENQNEANPLNKMFAYDAVLGTYAIVLNRSV